MAASRRVVQIGLLLMSSLAVASGQGTDLPRPPWTWNNGAAVSPIMGQQSSTYWNGALPQQSSTYWNGALPQRGYTMGGAVNPIVVQQTFDPKPGSRNAQYLAAYRNARIRTEGESAVAKQGVSHVEMHERNPLTPTANTSLQNSGKSHTSKTLDTSGSASSQRSSDALDADPASSNREVLAADRAAGPQVGDIVVRAMEIPDTEANTAAEISENQTSRSETTSSLELTHHVLDEPDDDTSMRMRRSAEAANTAVEISENQTSRSETTSSLELTHHDLDEALDDTSMRMRRSAEAASWYRNDPGVPPYWVTSALGSLSGPYVEEIAYGPGNDPSSPSVPESTDILARLGQISQQFVDIYREIVSLYAPDLKTPLDIPSLVQEMSSSEDDDYSMNTGLISEIQYAIAKGKRFIELYHKNMDELKFLSQEAVTLREHSCQGLDDAPGARVMSDEVRFRDLSELDLDDGTTVGERFLRQTSEDEVVESRISHEENTTARLSDDKEEYLKAKVFPRTITSEPTPLPKNDNVLNEPESEIITYIVQERRLIPIARQVTDSLLGDTPQERINDAPISSSLVKEQAINSGQHADASVLASKSAVTLIERKISENKATKGTHQLLVAGRTSGSQDVPISDSNRADHSSNAAKSGGREDIARTALLNKGSMGRGSKINEKMYAVNTDPRTAFPRGQGAPMFPDRKFAETGVNRQPVQSPFAASPPNWMARGRRSVGRKTAGTPLGTNGDEIPAVRSQAMDASSFSEIEERIAAYSTDKDESVTLNILKCRSTHRRRDGRKREITEDDISHRDIPEVEDYSDDVQIRLFVEPVAERNGDNNVETSHTDLLDNIRASTELANNIQNLLERVDATIPQLQGSNFPGNTGLDTKSYLEKKAQDSVKRILSIYSAELSDILGRIVAEDADSVIFRALSVYFLARQRLLNDLLLKNIAYLEKRLNASSKVNTQLLQRLASSPRPQQTGQVQNQESFPVYERPGQGFPQQTSPTQNYKTFPFYKTGTPQQTIKPQTQQPFFTYNTAKYQTPIQPQIPQQTVPEALHFLEREKPQQTIPTQNYNTFPFYKTHKIETPQQTIKPQTQQPFSVYNTAKYQTPIQPQIPQGFSDFDSLQRPASSYFPGQGSPQQASQPQIQRQLHAYNIPRDQKPTHFPWTQIQQPLPVYNILQHKIPSYTSQPELQQPLPAYNTEQKQIPSYFPQPIIQQPLPAYNIQQHQTPSYFPQQQIQSPFAPHNTLLHQTPPYFPQPEIQQPLSAFNAPQPQTLPTFGQQHVGLQMGVQRSSLNRLRSNSSQQKNTEEEQNEDAQGSNVDSLIKNSTQFLQSKWLLQELRNDNVKLFCNALIEGSASDDAVDGKLYTDTFSTVVADYILRLFDHVAGRRAGVTRLINPFRKRKRNENKEISYKTNIQLSDFLTEVRASDQNEWSIVAQNSYSLRLRHLLDALSPIPDPFFYRAFYSHCQINASGLMKCTPSNSEHEGPAPSELYQVLKNEALQRTIPNSCSPLFESHQRP